MNTHGYVTRDVNMPMDRVGDGTDELGDNLTDLHRAVLCGDTITAGMLIENGAPLEAKTSTGYTPLLIACYNGDLEMVEYLVDRNASLEATDSNHNTPLHIASKNNRLKVLRYLLDKKANLINAFSYNFETPISYAGKNGYVDVIELLIEKGANDLQMLEIAASKGSLDIIKHLLYLHKGEKEYGGDILHIACRRGCLNIVQYLIDEMDYDATRADFWEHKAPLDHAVQSGNVHLVKYLMDQKNITQNRNEDTNRYMRYSLLHGVLDRTYSYSEIPGALQVLRYLIEEKHFDVNDTDNDGDESPLQTASHYGNLPAVKYLIERGADSSITDKSGWSALHFAARSGHLHLIQFFIEEQNIDVNVRNSFEETPLHKAVDAGGWLDVLYYLAEQGADVNAVTKNGYSALHLAAASGSLDAVKFLIDAGSDLKLQCESGKTPVDLAILHERKEIIKFLRKHVK